MCAGFVPVTVYGHTLQHLTSCRQPTPAPKPDHAVVVLHSLSPTRVPCSGVTSGDGQHGA
jgi:hypothetical protein